MAPRRSSFVQALPFVVYVGVNPKRASLAHRNSERVVRRAARFCELCVGVIPVLVACGDAERPPPLAHLTSKDASVQSRDSGRDLDAGNDVSTDGSPSGDATGANSDAPLADGGAGGPDGSDGDAGGQALNWTCDGNYAYWATSLERFESPTPEPLAEALKAISKRVPALSLVLHLQEGELFGALSATIAGTAGKEMFPVNRIPPFSPTVRAFGTPPGITTLDAQPHGFLRFVDDVGPVEIQIEHLVWRATEGRDCGDVSVRVQAVVPTSQFSVVLHVAGSARTLGELVDTSDDGGVSPSDDSGIVRTPVEIAFAFQGVPMTFDFSERCCSP
jgi:hypothetical protein